MPEDEESRRGILQTLSAAAVARNQRNRVSAVIDIQGCNAVNGKMVPPKFVLVILDLVIISPSS